MVFSERRIQAAFIETINFFQSKRFQYMIIGAIAVSMWGRTRATADLDFQVRLASLETLLESVPPTWILDKKWDLYNPLIRHVQKRFLVSGILMDLMLPRDPLEVKAFSRRVRKRLWGKMVYVVSPEDLVLMKMKVGRPRDFDDAASIVEIQKSLNRAYIYRWASKLALHQEFAYLFRKR